MTKGRPKDKREKITLTIDKKQGVSICPSFRYDETSKDSVITQIVEFLKNTL